jgi:hypothetical protein
MSVFADWTCTFPGKMGLSWKRAWHGVGTKEEAEAQAAKNCNVVAVPLQLFETMKEHERRMVAAEAERGRLVEGCIRETWRQTVRTLKNAEEDLDDEHGWEWRFGAAGGFVPRKDQAITAVRKLAGLPVADPAVPDDAPATVADGPENG